MIKYQPTLDYGIYRTDSFDNKLFQGGCYLTQHDSVIKLWAMLKKVQELEPELWTEFRRACDELNLDYADGIAVTVRTGPEHMTQPRIPRTYPRQIISPLSSEEIFVIARDALIEDRTEKIFRERGFLYSELVEVLEYNTEQFEIGDDPRQPW